MDLSLKKFKDTVGRGTRPNRYEVSMPIPYNGTLTYEVSALSLPAASLGTIAIPFRGRVLKLPGDRRFGSWSFTVYDTESKIWNALDDWSNRINDYDNNRTNYTIDGDLNENWTVRHYDLNGDDLLKKVTLYNCWISNISPFELAYGSIDTMSQFSCTVEYEYFNLENGN